MDQWFSLDHQRIGDQNFFGGVRRGQAGSLLLLKLDGCHKNPQLKWFDQNKE
jgi:hypothetical protein